MKNTSATIPLQFQLFAWMITGIGWLLLSVTPGEAAERRLVPDTEKKVVVIDPGHGGSDRGAQGPDGSLEKDVTLKIARLVAMRLRHNYRAVLSRSDDYSLSLVRRTETANRHRAEVFVSIHSAGHFLHTKNGSIIFFYQEKSNDTMATTGSRPMPEARGRPRNQWDSMQLRHKAESKKLAKAIYERLCPGPIGPKCRIENAPLMVLMGADMPAVLIEVGHITNPQDERKMNDKEELSTIAANISTGIIDYLSNRQGDGILAE